MSAGGYYGMILNAIGGAAQSYAAWKDQEATYKAIQNEMQRQGKFAGQEYSLWSGGVQQQGAETAAQQMAQAQKERAQGYSSMEATPLTTEGSLGKRFGETGTDRAYSAMRAGERAKLLSYGDWAHVQNIAKMGVAQNIAHVQDTAEGAARLFPYEQWNAQHKMDQLAGMGAMLQGGSNMAQFFSSPQQNPGSGGGVSYTNVPGGISEYVDPNYGVGSGVDYYVMPQINQQGQEVELPNYYA